MTGSDTPKTPAREAIEKALEFFEQDMTTASAWHYSATTRAHIAEGLRLALSASSETKATCKQELVTSPGVGEMKWCEQHGYYFGKDQECPASALSAIGTITAEQLADVKDQCEQGLIATHDCPAVFALAAIYAELFPEVTEPSASTDGSAA